MTKQLVSCGTEPYMGRFRLATKHLLKNLDGAQILYLAYIHHLPFDNPSFWSISLPKRSP